VPSAEQIDNRRRGRAEDRIREIAQDRIGLLTFTLRNKNLDSLACKTGAALVKLESAGRSRVGRARGRRTNMPAACAPYQ
jgi:hypothetical protein